MRTKRIVALIAALLFAAVVSWSQNARVKDIRQTYLWDVTLSMKGKPKSNPNIWEPVKKALIADIQAIPDESTEIVVIPFQHKALDTWRAPATEAGKAAMIKRINAYDIPLEYVTANGKRTTMTFLGQTVANHQILRWLVHTQTVFTTSRLDGKSIVACIHRTVFYQNILARLNIHAVAAIYMPRFFRLNIHTTYNHILTIGGHYVPEWRTQ